MLADGLRKPVKTVVSRWGEHGLRPEPAAANDALFGAIEATATVEVACTPMAAWQLVADIGRIGEFSPECADARWTDGATFPAEGARFEGTNRVVNENHDSQYIWIRPCKVTVRGRQSTSATRWATVTTEHRPLSGTSGSRRPQPVAASLNNSATSLTA